VEDNGFYMDNIDLLLELDLYFTQGAPNFEKQFYQAIEQRQLAKIQGL